MALCPTCLQPKLEYGPSPIGICCPLCHAPSDTDIVLRGIYLIRLSDRLTVKLLPSERNLLQTLIDARGAVTQDHMIERQYPPPRDEPKNARHIVFLGIATLRKKIQPFKWVIENIRPGRYVLVTEEKEKPCVS